MRSRLLITAAAGYFFNIVSLNYATETPPVDRENLTPQGSHTQLVSAPFVDEVNQKFNKFLNSLDSKIPQTETLLTLIDPNDKKISLWKLVPDSGELVKVAEEYRVFLEQEEAPRSVQKKWEKLKESIERVHKKVNDSDSDSEDSDSENIDVRDLLKWWDESTRKLKEKYKSLWEELQNSLQGTLNDLVEKCNRKLQELRVPEADEQLQRVRELSHKVYEEFYIKHQPFHVGDFMYNESVIALLEQLQIDPPHREHQYDLSSIDRLIKLDDSKVLHLLLKIHAPSSTDIEKLKKMFSPGTSRTKMNAIRAYEYLKRSLDYWKLLQSDEGDDIRFLTIRFLQKGRKDGVSEDDDVEYTQNFRKSVKKSIEVCLDLNTTRQQLLEEMQKTIKANLFKYLREIKAKIAMKENAKKAFKKEDYTSISSLQKVFLSHRVSDGLDKLLEEVGLQSLQQDLQYLIENGIIEALPDIEGSPSKSIQKPRNSKREREESIPDEEPLNTMPSGAEKEKVEHGRPPHNTHDKFLQMTFEQIPMARDFFEKALPVDILNLLDLTDLINRSSILNGSDFSQGKPNSLFKVKLKNDEKYIFLLIKHLTARQLDAPKMICDYVEKVKQTYEKELKELSCSYKPRVITIVLHTGATKLTPEYLDLFNQYTGHILDFFSVRIAPPVILKDLWDQKWVNSLADFRITAFIIRHVRLRKSLPESRAEILRKLDGPEYKKYRESLEAYIYWSPLEKSEKELWRSAFKKKQTDVEETDDASTLGSQLVDVGKTLAQALESLGPKATAEEVCDAVRQSCFNQNRKRPREDANVDAVIEDTSEEEDLVRVRNHKYTSGDIARLFKQLLVEESQDPFVTFTLNDQDDPQVENLLFRQGNAYVLPPLIAEGGLLIDSIKALFDHSSSQTHPPRMILVPYNPGGHWVTLQINIPEEGDLTIAYIDSLMDEDDAINQSRIKVANDFMGKLIQQLQQQIPAFSNRTMKILPVINPRIQCNDIDCGVLTVLNVIDIVNGKTRPRDCRMEPDVIKTIRAEHRSKLKQMGKDFEFEGLSPTRSQTRSEENFNESS